MKKAIVLAGGFDQIALIKELKVRDYQVYLIDYYDNPPAKRYADKHYSGSTLNLDYVRKIASEIKPDLICTACTDQALHTAAVVSEGMGLPTYISAETARNVTNKSFMKKVLMDNSIPTSKYYVIQDLNEIDNLDIKFPLIIKPADCNSSKGVKKASTRQELFSYLKDALNYSRTGTAIVEEFKSGKEFSADFYIENGKAKLLSVTESKKIPDNGAFTIAKSIYPVTTPEQNANIERIGQTIANAFNLTQSPMLVQMIEEDGNLYVLEFSARMGGGSKYQLIKELSGVNIMSVYVDLITGNAKSNIKVFPYKGFAEVDYIYCKNGLFTELIGFEDALKNHIIDYFFQYKMPGSVITQSLTSGDRIGGVLISGKSEEDVQSKRDYFNKLVKVLDSCGNDIMNHNLISKL